MKKILFLLLLSIASYGQAPFPEGIDLGGNTATAETSKIVSQQPGTGTLNYINATALPVNTATQNALDMKLNISDLPTNLTLYATNATSDIPGYTKMVTSISDPEYNTVAVDVSTPAITTTAQLVSQRVSAPGVLVGQPGVFNITNFGNIRRVSGTGTATFYFEVYHRDLAGVETLICTSGISAVVSLPTYVEFTASAVWNDGEFEATDRIVIKTYANRIPGNSDPVYQIQYGGVSPVRTLLPVPFSVVDAGYELKANKSTTLTPSDTLYPTNNAVLAALPKTYTTTVYVNANDPNIATIFDDENPPTVNDNALKSNTDNLYIGADASTWVYNGITYVTKIVPASSNFYINSTSIDAGNSKDVDINRIGSISTSRYIAAGSGLVSRLGSSNIENLGSYLRLANKVGSENNQFQLNASNGVDLWNYSSGTWNKRFTFSSDGYLTATNGRLIGGTGTTNYIPKFTSTNSIGNSIAYFEPDGLIIKETNPSTYSSFTLRNNTSTANIQFGIYNSLHSNANKGFIFGSGTLSELGFYVGAVKRLNILDNGNASFSNDLSVNGSISTSKIKISNDYSGTEKGLIIENTTLGTYINSTQSFGDIYFGGNGKNVGYIDFQGTYGLLNVPGHSVNGTLALSEAGGNTPRLQIGGGAWITQTGAGMPLSYNSYDGHGFRDYDNNIIAGIGKTQPDKSSYFLGNVSIGTSVNDGVNALQVNGSIKATALTLSTTPTTSSGTYDFVTRNTTTGVVEKVSSNTIATTASPTFTGIPTAPTAPPGTNTPQIATMEALQAADSSNVKLTGNQTKTGLLSFQNTGGLVNGISVTTNTAGSPNEYGALFNNAGTGGSAMFVSASNGGFGQFVGVAKGTGVFIDVTGNIGQAVGLKLQSNASTGNLLEFPNGRIDNLGNLEVSKIISTNVIKLKNYTVATLPTGTQGDTAYVTDATAPTYLGTLTGGGTVVCPVFYDGSAWVAH